MDLNASVYPWHYHPGPAIIVVEKGEFTLTQDDSNCSTATYVAQEGNHPVVWEEAFNIHRPANLSGAETTIFITFLDIPSDSPDMIAADPQVCNQNSASLSPKAKAVASARPASHQMQDAYPQRSSGQPTAAFVQRVGRANPASCKFAAAMGQTDASAQFSLH